MLHSSAPRIFRPIDSGIVNMCMSVFRDRRQQRVRGAAHVLFTAVMTLAAVPAFGAQPDLASLLRHYDEMLLNAAHRGDRATWENLTTPDFAYIEAGEIRPKAVLLKELKEDGKRPLAIRTYSVNRVGDTAMVTHEDEVAPNPLTASRPQGRYLMTETWQSIDGDWKLRLVHIEPVRTDPPAIKLASAQLDELVGTYRAGGDSVVIRREGDHLAATHPDQSPMELQAETRDVFFSPGDIRMRYIFQRDAAAGAVAEFVRRNEHSDVHFIRVEAAAAAGGNIARADDTQADVDRVLKLFDVPGVAIAVVKDDKVLLARGFGVRKLGDPAPVDGQTLFEIAANSKAFTSAMLAMLVDEGKLAWDDPVTRHLPDFQMADPYVTREMTIRDLLANRSGLGEGAGDLLWWPASTFSTDEIIHNMRFLAPATGFRSGFTYEYLPYIVAGKIVAQKTGKPWGDAVRERILTPLGMGHTTTSLAENAGVIDQAAPHSSVDGKLSVIKATPMANAAGAMGINTSAEDIAKWMTVLLDGGKLATPGADGKQRRLFSAAQSREMWTPQTPIRVSEPTPRLAATRSNFAAYGLGFDLRDYKGVTLASHRGWQFGSYSTVVLVPSQKLGIAILTNAESVPALNALRYRLLDRYLDLAPTDWISAVAEVSAESQAKADVHLKEAGGTPAAKSSPSLALAAYDGEYRDPWYGSATIRTVGAKHILSFARTPDLTGELQHFRHDTFIVRWKERSLNADAYVTFSLNPDGSIERMKMAPVSSETDTSFDFNDLTFTPVKPAAVD